MNEQTRRVALAIWNGRISPVFDVARQLVLLEVQNGRIGSRREEALPGTDPMQQARRLSELKPETLICGAISQPLLTLLAAGGIRVVPFVAGDVEEVVVAYLQETLPNRALSMPGCCRQRGACGAGGGRLRHRGGRCPPRNRTGFHEKQPTTIQGASAMKVILTASGKSLTDCVDPRFGRAKFFLLVDTATGAMTAHDNAQNLNAAQGAGIQAAETVVRLGATVVITGNVGPKAFRALSVGGVKVYPCEACAAAEALRRFTAGELKEATTANVEGHWA